MSRAVFVAAWLVSQVCLGSSFENELVSAAIDRTRERVTYDGSYFAIPYPNGDVPSHIGVCTDVVIRSYRALGIDLQKLVHEDMAENFAAYPSNRIWGMRGTDTNIDHRRVPNLRVFFARKGQALAVSNDPADYLPGDIVTWRLPGNQPHIGIVTDQRSDTTANPLIVHNIGRGPRLEDRLFAYEVTGRYRYVPETDCMTADSLREVAIVDDSRRLYLRVSGFQEKEFFYELYDREPAFNNCGMANVEPVAVAHIDRDQGVPQALQVRGASVEIVYQEQGAMSESVMTSVDVVVK